MLLSHSEPLLKSQVLIIFSADSASRLLISQPVLLVSWRFELLWQTVIRVHALTTTLNAKTVFEILKMEYSGHLTNYIAVLRHRELDFRFFSPHSWYLFIRETKIKFPCNLELQLADRKWQLNRNGEYIIQITTRCGVFMYCCWSKVGRVKCSFHYNRELNR